jgi:predicted RNA-binding protein (TIGR00451 family)
MIADYQFGRGTGNALFDDRVEVERSKRTGKIRYIRDGSRLIATLRAKDGHFALTIEGARHLLKNMRKPSHVVRIREDVSEVVAEGRNVFAKHVVRADEGIRPKDEVIVLSQRGRLLAVGRAVLSGFEMPLFKLGVAVSVRAGTKRQPRATVGFVKTL